MGSPFTIILYHQDSSFANAIAAQAFGLVDSLVNIYSNYIPESELNRLSASSGSGRFVTLSPALLDILKLSKKAYRLSHHRFDITIGPLSDLWRKARRENIFPPTEVVKAHHALTGFQHIDIKHKKSVAKLQKAGMRLDLGGIAQGYIADKVLQYIRQHAIHSVLVDVSGDIAMGDAPPGKTGWIVGVNLPHKDNELQEKKLTVSNRAVSTSGDVYQYISHEGKRYSHIIDPQTGYGVTEGKNVTVIAINTTTADWLATACSILPVKKAKKLARKMKAELMVAWMEGNRLNMATTRGFNKYWK